MRMEYPGTTEKDEQKIRNRLQQRMARFREKFSMVSRRDTAGDNNAVRDRVLSRLTPARLAARSGLGSTRSITPGSRDSQRRVIPVPGRKTQRSTKIGNLAAQLQQPHAQSALVGPAQTTPTGLHSASSQVNRQSCSCESITTSQQNGQINTASMNRQPHTRSASSATLPNSQSRAGTNLKISSTQKRRPSTSQAARTVPRYYSGMLLASPSETLQDFDGEWSDGNDADDEDSGSEYQDDGECFVRNEAQESPKGDEYDGELDAEMPLAEEDSQIELLPAKDQREMERSLEQDRKKTQMCADGKISLHEPLLGTQKSQVELKQGLKRARRESRDDDEVEDHQNQRAKWTRIEEGATRLSDEPVPESLYATHSGFDDLKPGRWGMYSRQGTFAQKYRLPNTRPVGSAVHRLHNDRQRHPAPKATVGQTDIYKLPSYPQTENNKNNEWTVYSCDTDLGQPQGRSLQRQSQDDGVGNSDPHIHTGGRQT